MGLDPHYKYGTETVINRYVDWFVKLVRKHTQRIPNVKSLWEDFSWDIAMRMRASETFQVIMADIARVTDTMQQPLMKRPRTGKGSDSHYKGKGKGYQQRWSPPGQGRRYRSSTWTSSSSTWRPWQQSPPQWQVHQQPTWPTSSPTTWQPTPPPSFPADSDCALQPRSSFCAAKPMELQGR